MNSSASPAIDETAPAGAPVDTTAGWVKYGQNPVLGGQYGTCFDIAVLRENGGYRMWVSWRPQRSIALVESRDGLDWSAPEIVLPPAPTFWEEDINRPVVLKRADGYHMWYTGQAKGKHSWIGYATSPDGLTWTKHAANPVFAGAPAIAWEQERATACQVVRHGDWHLMFYIGFRDIHHAQIGVARSRDGITHWERHPENPIIRSGTGKWDDDACYKPYTIFDGTQWLLWYNGRRECLEQIGVAIHQGEDLGFPAAPAAAAPVLEPAAAKDAIATFNRNGREIARAAQPEHVTGRLA